jgi:glycosyltransferase involved in cell wall biosynthesis
MTAPRTKRVLSLQPVADGGGSETALIAMLGQLAADGWECHVALPSQPRLASEYAAAGATVHVVPTPRLTTTGAATRWLAYGVAWPMSVVRLAWLARRLQVNVIHSNSLHCWQGWAVATLLRRPHIWHAREIVFQSPAALRLERSLTRRFATVVIAASRAVAEQLDPVNVTVVTDEPDARVFHPHRAGRFRRVIGIEDTTPLVGSVARLDTWKGFDVLLDAFEALRRLRPNLELVVAGGSVAGKEAYADRLEQRATAMAGVHWLGRRRDIPDLMADLDVFVQVSTQPEPFGLVLVEALATGVPVVAGAAGGPIEILDDAHAGSTAGRLVTPGDPAALAEAVLALLPSTSSTESRKARTPLRPPARPAFPAVFDRVVTAPPSGPWPFSPRDEAGTGGDRVAR